MSVLVISFDSVSDKVFRSMAEDDNRYPAVARFKREAYYQGGVKTVFLSNTYPVHISVSTGKLPKDHGIISNLLPPKKNGERPWAQMAKYIKSKTIWEAAKEKKLSVAAMFWPATNGADIDYNMPETHPEKGQNILLRSLRYGSAMFQLAALFRHGGKIIPAIKSYAQGGGGQPALDNFTAAVTCDTLRRKKPDLALVHLIAYDSIFHCFGSKGNELENAKKALDNNLGKILESYSSGGSSNSASNDMVIVFSDHAQLDVGETVNLRARYGDAVFEQAGGSAFLRAAIDGLERRAWFERYLTNAEMQESGYSEKPVLGIAAKPGYAFSESGAYKGNHGYPADYEDYEVFYAVKGGRSSGGFAAGQEQKWLKKRITDITAIIARELNLDMDILKEYQPPFEGADSRESSRIVTGPSLV